MWQNLAGYFFGIGYCCAAAVTIAAEVGVPILGQHLTHSLGETLAIVLGLMAGGIALIHKH